MAALLEVSLEDKYQHDHGRVLATGIQALVRLPLEQRRRDQKAGLNTAGYVSGYRGSPLGAYDQQLSLAKPYLDQHHIVHQPGVNEDLAATACQGTQQVGLSGESRYDGVFAIWYGKGPGVDRSGDAIRHGNLFGTAKHGGVLCLLGDDHICESSTTAHQSEYAMVDANVPILNPSGVQEILDYGLYSLAMSRHSGAWVALKCIHDTVECTATLAVDQDRFEIVIPEGGPCGSNIDLDSSIPIPITANELERRTHYDRLEAAKSFVRANRLDRIVLGDDQAKLGVVSTGKSYLDLIAALEALGIDQERACVLGLRVYKVAMPFPLEPQGLEEAVMGLDQVMVVEEKRGLIESQAKELLYGGEHCPIIVGKRDQFGATLFPSNGALDANQIAIAIAKMLLARIDDADLRERLVAIEAVELATLNFSAGMVRLPWFCPGCPHNSSTKVGSDDRVIGGIGCHTMVMWMDRNMEGFTQMGGEGASWVGEAPFSTRDHVFQNVGDGTFFHSGSMAVRAAVASGVNITYKLLYNDAVAMTGGQKMETANLTVPRITQLLAAEGVKETAIVSDNPGKYPIGTQFAHGVRSYHRDDLETVQRRLASIEGVTVLIYDQTCAAEMRRRRKRGTYPDPDQRIWINDLVCEGCGDCGVQSNCVAIQPLETPFGRKRQIDQSACNKDFSCLKGFCPSFVTVHGGRLKKQRVEMGDSAFANLPQAHVPALDRSYALLVAGIGGTGVVTIAALLAMAAHLEGKGAAGLDMIGLAQKGGAVVSHLKLAPSQDEIGAPRIAKGGADLVLGCDMMVAAGRTALPTITAGRTQVIANLEEVMTGAFTADADLQFPTQRLIQDLRKAAGKEAVELIDATALAKQLLGDGIAANLFVVGVAWQRGLLPLSRQAIERAIELNAVAVTFNKQAFLWGRRYAHDPAAVLKAAGHDEKPPKTESLDEMIARRADFLAGYQDRAYAQHYRQIVARMRDTEAAKMPGREQITKAVARYLFKLMAIKDEYEVARLQSPAFLHRQLETAFEDWQRLDFHFAPPILAKRDPDTGHQRKRRYGPWVQRLFPLLASLRRLRGTRYDFFGWTAERRLERRLLQDYEALVDEVMERLDEANYDCAVALLCLPEQIRGYGHVKQASIERFEARREELLTALRRPADEAIAAE